MQLKFAAYAVVSISTLFVLSAVSAPLASAQISYPKAKPSAYYVVPPQSLSFSGSGFSPSERVTITGGGLSFATYADARGRISFPNLLTVPFSWQNTKQAFVIEGQESAYAIPMTVSVGTYYPQISPSAYYVAPGESMYVSGTGFAPNESVQISIDGALFGSVSANAKGTMLFGFFAPAAGSSFSVSAQGLLSGQSSERTVTLMQ